MRRDRSCSTGEDLKCSSCNEIKPLDDFSQDKTRVSGVRNQCKKCKAAYAVNLRSRRNPAILASLRSEALANLKEDQQCVKCKETKPLSEFVSHKHSRTGISKKCRDCIRKDAEKDNALTRTPNYRKDRTLQRQYGINHDEYMRLLSLQKGVCAICKHPETRTIRGTPTSLCVDHDHVTGRVRGLLCSKCNAAIGMLSDDLTKIYTLAAYLEEHEAKNALDNDE